MRHSELDQRQAAVLRAQWRGALLAPLLLAHCAAALAAEPLSSAKALEERSLGTERTVQESVSTLDDETRERWDRHDSAARELAALRSYRNHLERAHAVQQERLERLDAEEARLDDTRDGLVPLLLRMLERLERLTTEPPFLLEERRTRLSDVRVSVADPGLSLADQYRKVYRAYLAELEHASTVGAERATVELAGERRVGELLRIGRLQLFFIGLDKRGVAVWREDRWEPLPDRYAVPVLRALRVASKQVSPAFLRLPFRTRADKGG